MKKRKQIKPHIEHHPSDWLGGQLEGQLTDQLGDEFWDKFWGQLGLISLGINLHSLQDAHEKA